MHLRMIALVIVLMDTYVEGGGQFVNNKIFKKTISVLEKRLKEKLAISDGGCKKDWNQFKDHCYYFSKEKKSWFEAERFCRTENSSLVNINDVNENNWLMSNLKATDKDNAFEEQSNRHFLLQFGENSANESLSQTDDEALWKSEDNSDTNELLSELDSPCCNYWDFSKPRSSNRYKNLPVNFQSNQITQKPQDDNGHSDDQVEDMAINLIKKKKTTKTSTEYERFRYVTDADLESFIKEQESKNTSRKQNLI
ncbi:unnamed protein product [Mytilus coruscus]|uniref:C-type lectin domain-containing protein n=1 Tax=Mytilus coruscus TaxID=42192 RepID=A0A6J8CML2_MYTCO|nr:unnamed protein product [Mytilus coruscus]